jgi:hypothetical protein
VQHVRQQGEQRYGYCRVLVIGGAQDPGLRDAGAQAQFITGRQGLLGGCMVERHGVAHS